MILTYEEAKESLRAYDDDKEMIERLIKSAQEYLLNTTGKRWEEDEPINPVAKLTATYLLMKWFDTTDEFDKTIQGLITILTPMAR